MTALHDNFVKVSWPPGVLGDRSFTASIDYADEYVWVTVRDEIWGGEETNWFPWRQAAAYGDSALARMIELELRTIVDKLKVRRQPMMKWECPVELDEEFWLS